MTLRLPRLLRLLAPLALFTSASWALSVTSGCPPPAAEQNAPYTFVISYTNNEGPVTFTLNQALPAGLNLVSPGTISGTPTVNGVFTISVGLMDMGGATATYNCSLIINPPLIIGASCPVQHLVVGAPFSLALNPSGGEPPYSYELSVPPPAGIMFNDVNGTFSGAPSSPGTNQLSVVVYDLAGGSVQFTCNLQVDLFQITAPCPAAGGMVGAPYSFTVSVEGSQQLTWSLQQGPLPPGLMLNSSTGVISGTPTAAGSYPFIITVSAVGAPPQTYSCSITIAPPPLSVTSACPISSFPATLTASGGTGNYSFSIVGALPPNLALNGATIAGQLSASPGTYPFTIQVSDGQTTAQKPCSIVVTAPPLSVTSTCPISSFPSTLTAAGGTGNYTFSIIGALPPNLTLNGATIAGQLNAAPGTYPFTIQVSDGQTTAQKPCSVVVTTPPVQITSGCPPSLAPQGQSLSFLLTATGGTGSFLWSIIGSLPPGVTLSGNTISGTPTGPQQNFPFQIHVDSGGASASIDCEYTITAPVLMLTSGCPPSSGTPGVNYGPFALTATGGLGSGSYTFSVSGTLPTGVTLAGSSIAGNPTAAGTFNFTISVDSGQQHASSPGCTVVIAEAPAALQITAACPTGPFTTGQQVTIAFTVTGGRAPYSYSLTGASWLMVANQSGTTSITGTPGSNDTGPFAITLTATDSTQATTTFHCNLTVNAPAPGALQILGSCPSAPFTPGTSATISVSATGGVAPYSWSLTGTSGLALSASEGTQTSVMGSVPAQEGTYSLTLTLKDSAGGTPATLNCNLVVQFPALTIQGSCPAPKFDLPVQLSVAFTAQGGKEPYSWTLNGPSWLGLSAAAGASTSVGSIGTPSTSGNFSFTLTLTDGFSQTQSITCNSTINPPAPPKVQLTGLTLQMPLLSPTTDGITLSPAPLLPITGTAQLSFVPNAFGITDNPQVYFNGGSRTATFTIPAGSTTFSLPSVQQGTDAGTIHLEITALQQGGVDVLATPHPSLDLVIPRQAPAVGITDVRFADETANGFTIVIGGFSTPRDVQSITLAFQPAQGASLSGTTSFSISVNSLFSQYYSTAASQLVGSQWQNLQIPITLSGDKTAVGSVSVTLANSAGSSQPVTLNR